MKVTPKVPDAKPGLVRAVVAELRLLRRLPGPLTDSKLTHARLILTGLGGGDTSAALNRLHILQVRHQEDAEIAAAFATIGVGVEGDNVLDRLNDYGATRFVDARTVRRWSDAGIDKLAALIVSEAPWIDPRIGLRLSVEDETLLCHIEFVMPDRLGMNRPQFVVNGESRELTYHHVASDNATAAVRYRCDTASIALEGLTKVELALRWTGEITASYVYETRQLGAWQTRCRLRLREMFVVVERSR